MLHSGNEIRHLHETLQAQVAGETCCKCAADGGSSSLGGCKVSQSPDLAVVGSPCPPFSQMRSKRFKDGTTKAHKEFETTFTDVIQWILKFEPVTVIMEQVAGFDKPLSVDECQTPLQLLLGPSIRAMGCESGTRKIDSVTVDDFEDLAA